MNVDHLLHQKGYHCFTIEAGRPLREAVRLMMRHKVGALLATEDGRLAGIVTERDVLRAADEQDGQVDRLRINDVMTTDLVTCHKADGVDHAMNLMIHNPTGRRIRHLPVVENGELIGVISIGDVITALLTETRFENRLLKNYIKNWPDPE